MLDINMAAQEAAFDDEETDPDEKYVAQNDLKKLKDAHFKAGLREGITAGTHSTLQDGFNWGYKEAFFNSYKYGKLKGLLSAILSYLSLENNENYKDRINQLISKLAIIEEHYSKITSNTTCDSTTNAESVVDKTSHCSADQISNQRLAVDDSSEFKELLIQCKGLCDELGLDPDVVGISS